MALFKVYWEVVESGTISGISANSEEEAKSKVMDEYGEDPHYQLTAMKAHDNNIHHRSWVEDGPTLNITDCEEDMYTTRATT